MNISQDLSEQESASKQEPPSLIVGQDGESHWVVVETHGLCGGIFASEAAAMHYAREESRGNPGAVRVAQSSVVLNLQEAPHRPAFMRP